MESIEGRPRERWASRVGLVLAMAGNAVGIGNFLRFPVQAAQNGGGTFMIPYFVAFLLLGVPIMWIEWTMGRYGGRFGYATLPGMFDRLTGGRRWAKYVGVLGVAMPTLFFVYYTYVVSWMLGFSVFSLTGGYFGLGYDRVLGYLYSFQNIFDASSHGGWVALLFFCLTLVFLGRVLSRGISGGIEKLALVGMPLLFLFAFILMARVLTLPAAAATPAQGLNFIWNPQWSSLGDARVWLAASGQMFFTLSLGLGTIQTYASYLAPDDDVTLTGLSTAATNEFAEVVLGGTIAIPAAVVFFGIPKTLAIANAGPYDLPIAAMAAVFSRLPGPEMWARVVAFLWFFLLFIAGITSSVALASPGIAFLQERLGRTRRRAVREMMLLALGLGLLHVVFYRHGFLAEWDYWIGTFGLVVFAAVEVAIFVYIFGIGRGWAEMHRGADLHVPAIYRPVMKWVTPLFLFTLLAWWSVTEALPTFLMRGVADPSDLPYRWASRAVMIGVVAIAALLLRRSWATVGDDGRSPGAVS